jgi:hypothetical protein
MSSFGMLLLHRAGVGALSGMRNEVTNGASEWRMESGQAGLMFSDSINPNKKYKKKRIPHY